MILQKDWEDSFMPPAVGADQHQLQSWLLQFWWLQILWDQLILMKLIWWNFMKWILMKFNMDPILQDRSLAYATSPNFRLNYFFLRCRGTGPIFLRTVFKHEYTGFSLKLSKLMVPNLPQIKVSKVKLIFRSLYCFFYSCTADNVKIVGANMSKNYGTSPTLG